jgi:hypothetical protein
VHLEAVVGREHREGGAQVGVVQDVLGHLVRGSAVGQGSGFKIQGSGFRVQGSGFRV